MCGRRRIETERPELALAYGDMDFELVASIAHQLPPGIVVQLHNNGEALLYPRFGDAIDAFESQVTNVVSNGKLLVEKANQIIGRLDTLAISIVENDVEAGPQREIVADFLALKGRQKPHTILRLNGNVNKDEWREFGLPMATRNIHSPMGSYDYERRSPTIPEVGFCLDFMSHLAIDRNGKVSICVRFDPGHLGVIGDASKDSLESIWSGDLRRRWKDAHIAGRRGEVPLCARCEFWGVPTGWGDEYVGGACTGGVLQDAPDGSQ